MSIAGIVGRVGAFIGSGFGIGKIVGAFKKLSKIKKIVSELLAMKKEGEEAYNSAEALYKFVLNAASDKDFTKEEANIAVDMAYNVKKELDDVHKKFDELVALFK